MEPIKLTFININSPGQEICLKRTNTTSQPKTSIVQPVVAEPAKKKRNRSGGGSSRKRSSKKAKNPEEKPRVRRPRNVCYIRSDIPDSVMDPAVCLWMAPSHMTDESIKKYVQLAEKKYSVDEHDSMFVLYKNNYNIHRSKMTLSLLADALKETLAAGRRRY